MVLTELNKLMSNFDDTQLEVLAAIVVRMAGLKAERWTGKVSFELNSNLGSLGDLHVNKGEIVRFGGKKRKTRSRGI